MQVRKKQVVLCQQEPREEFSTKNIQHTHADFAILNIEQTGSRISKAKMDLKASAKAVLKRIKRKFPERRLDKRLKLN